MQRKMLRIHQQDEVPNVVLPRVASALEAIDGDDVDPVLLSRQRVADRGALVDADDPCVLGGLRRNQRDDEPCHLP